LPFARKGSLLFARILQPALACGLVVLAMCAPCRGEGGGEFVSTQGVHFVFRDAPFYYAGTNCYYLSYFSADVTRRGSVDELLDLCRDRGFNVIRVWAFNDGGTNVDGYPNEWAYQQTPTSEYNEVALAGLDYALDQARLRGLKLILTLTNMWDDYGGMMWYVDASPTTPPLFNHDTFYTDLQCKEWFKARIHYLLSRRNTFNDILYKDDPTIFAWELANEPRCWDDPGCHNRILRTWADEMTTYIKSLDPNHMVTIGMEGFYNGQYSGGWMYDGSQGTDFILDHQISNVDFCTVHLFPDPTHWYITDAQALLFLRRHLNDAAAVIGKPVILEEFGMKGPDRDTALEAWTDAVYDAAQADGAAAGWNIWMLEASGSGHDDGLSLFWEHADSVRQAADRQTIELLSTQAREMNSLAAPDFDVLVDGVIDILDMITVRNNLGSVPGSGGYIRADVTRDGKINILDMLAVRNHLSTTWP